MKLYLLTQKENQDYDTYDSCVVCASNIKDAVTIHPSDRIGPVTEIQDTYSTWTTIKYVECLFIGNASKSLKRGVICASFNAG